MQEVDVLKLLHLLESEYPQSFIRLDDRQKALKKELWVKEFAADDPMIVFAAVRILMRDGRECAPTSGQIREKIQSMTEKDTVEPQEAWALVSKACRNGYYGYKEEFAKLPPEVRKAVGCAEQLRDWSVMDEETFQSVIGSNFMRNYRVSQMREREMARIPQSVRDMIAGISNTMKLVEEG